jgi:hypothetical protein
MPKINDTNVYSIDNLPSLDDYVIGTENSSQLVKNYKWSKVLQLFSNSQQNFSFGYVLESAIISPDPIETPTEGKFTSLSTTTNFSDITQFLFHKTDGNGNDLTGFFNVINTDKNKVVFSFGDGSNVNFGYYLINEIITDTEDLFGFSVLKLGDIQTGALENGSSYYVNFDIDAVESLQSTLSLSTSPGNTTERDNWFFNYVGTARQLAVWIESENLW